MEGTHSGAAHEEVHPIGRTHVGEVHEGLCHVGAGQECEEGVAETTCDELTQSLSPIPWFQQGEEMEKIGSEIQAHREGARGNEFYDLVLFVIILLCFNW